MQFSSCQHRFQHIRRIHAAIGFARSDYCVELIDEKDDLSFRFLDRFKDVFQPFLKFAAVFRSRYKGTHIELEDLFVLKAYRHVAADDSARQTFNDSRLADTGLTDDDRVVFGSSRKDPDDPSDFAVTPDHRVEFPRLCKIDNVSSVVFPRIFVRFILVHIVIHNKPPFKIRLLL